jgi:ubiquinone/menaquinone biosynthesis C-methylase UbiE
VLDKERQVEFYNKKYKVNELNEFYTSATTNLISSQEVYFLKEEFRMLLKDKKPEDMKMLNIPCGNGRLNGLFSKFVSSIDCVDPCEKAIHIV